MIRSKTCFKCQTVKPLDEFYKHSAMGDGYLNKCKECNKKDALEHRLKNIEKVKKYDRERSKLPERMKLSAQVTRVWRAEDSRRAKAHSAVARAINKGKLTRQSCIRCGNKKTEAHHEDYDKPLDIVWLCCPCHKQRHKEIKQFILKKPV